MLENCVHSEWLGWRVATDRAQMGISTSGELDIPGVDSLRHACDDLRTSAWRHFDPDLTSLSRIGVAGTRAARRGGIVVALSEPCYEWTRSLVRGSDRGAAAGRARDRRRRSTYCRRPSTHSARAVC